MPKFLFALTATGVITALYYIASKPDGFSARKLSDALVFAAALAFVYSLEFIHTFFGFGASRKGSELHAYHRVKTDMDVHEKSSRILIPEYALAAALAAAAGFLLILLK